MKQHITIEQLNELSEKGKERLREWWKPQEGDMTDRGLYYYDGEHNYFIDKHDGKILCYPLLNIGQMVEFLQDHEYTGSFIDDTFDHMVGDEFSESFLRDAESDPIAATVAWSGTEELCDALWHLVKKVLENPS